MQCKQPGAVIRALALALCAGVLPATASDVVVLSKSELEFPREAVQAGADEGHVKAKLTIDARGEVSRVEILEAEPRRVFDRAVMRSLSQWRFNGGADGRNFVVDVDFRR